MGGVLIELKGPNSQSISVSAPLVTYWRMSSSSTSNNSSTSAAGTCSTNTTGTSRPTNDPITQILQGLHFMQNELQMLGEAK